MCYRSVEHGQFLTWEQPVLAGSLISDNTAGVISSAEIGKRAVENNYLFKHVRHLNNPTPRNSERLSKAGQY